MKFKKKVTASSKSGKRRLKTIFSGIDVQAKQRSEKVSYVPGKIYNFGERGSGFTIEGEPQEFDRLRNECLKSGKLFEDSQFPADESSLFRKNIEFFYNIEWKRPIEIVDKPRFVVDSFSRFDVKQGFLPDCWLLAAIANITMNRNIFFTVVPKKLNFRRKYAGIFHFRFWQFGRWVDVVIDDRLPTVNGQLRFLHSTEQNEFWPALLEKAYAKIHKCYEALGHGCVAEAMTDFTGGLTEVFKLRDPFPPNLYEIMLKTYKKKSLMGCTSNSDTRFRENITSTGMVSDHAYSITKVACIKLNTNNGTNEVQLVRLRNPWGTSEEWNGPYSDSAEEWNLIPEKVKKRLRLAFKPDGEFWMPFEHFCKEFSELHICNLRPESISQEELVKGSKKKWQIHVFEGQWVKGVSAGGSRNYKDTFWQNPQFSIELVHPDDDDKQKLCTVIIFIMTKHRRLLYDNRHIPIGFSIYHLNFPDIIPKPLDYETLLSYQSIIDSKYVLYRQLTSRHKLPPGTYCIIPTTYKPGEDGEFILQVFTEKKCDIEAMVTVFESILLFSFSKIFALLHREYDNKVNVINLHNKVYVDIIYESEAKRAVENENILKFFLKIADEDKAVYWMELKEVLDYAMKTELREEIFSKDICRSMIAMMDYDFSGKLKYEEFIVLWNNICLWRSVFKLYASDRNVLHGYKLRKAFNSAGYVLNNHILNILAHRYGNRDGFFTFDDFIVCAVRLKTMFDTFKLKDPDNTELTTFVLEEWILKTVYS